MPGWISYSFFLGIAIKSTAVLGVAAVAALLLRRRSAATRHLVWSAAFAAILMLPLLAISLPALRVPGAGSVLAPGFLLEANSSASKESSAHLLAGHGITTELAKRDPRPDWRRWVMFAWAAGTAMSFAQMFIGWVAILRLRREANQLTGLNLAPLTRLFGINEDVNVLETPRGSMPITFGLFHASIFLPAGMVEWSAESRRMVLLHELAHVRRGDSATHLLARTALGLYWWNPLAWIAWREFVKDRERAADDLVLSAGACASDYASNLLEIARSMQPAAAAFAAVPMARRSQLEGRLLAILDASVDHGTSTRVSPLLASLLAIGIIAPLAAAHAPSERLQAGISSNSFLEMIKNGDAALERRDYDAAKVLYTKALSDSGGGSKAATILIDLGTVELAKKNAAQAMDDFEQAQKADSEQTAEADMWMAITQLSQGNLEAADGLYRSSLSAEDPTSAAAATTMELYALLLRQEGKQDEANTMQSQATAIRKAQGTQAPATSGTSSSDVYQIGGDVKPPLLLSKVEPGYTEKARLAKYQGSALLAVEIGADGLLRNIRVVHALGFGLDEKAIEAVTKWKFKPAAKDGQPVTVSAHIEVNFRLL